MRLTGLGLALAMAVAACTATATPPTAEPSSPATPTLATGEPDAPLARFGTSLSPRSTSERDFEVLVDLLDDAGGLVLWAGEWSELAVAGGAPSVAATLARERGLTAVVATGFPRAGHEQRDLDPDRREDVLDAYADFAAEFEVPWLAIGVEIDDLASRSPARYAGFRQAFADIALAVHNASPATRVFPVFQYERLAGHQGGLFGGSETAAPQWHLLDDFPAADAIGFTTYPGLVFPDPDDTPADHYARVTSHTDLPVLFTEVGWSSDAAIAGWESTPDEQRDFVQRLGDLMEAVDPEAVVWSFLFDQQVEAPFDSMGLFDAAGDPRPAWDAWKQLAS